MADYIATARTNDFRVKDIAALKDELRSYGITPAAPEEARMGAEFVLVENTDGSIALYSYGRWPQLDDESVAARLDIDDEETPLPDQHEDLSALIASHLVDDEVAIFIEVGAEKMRYLGGSALAINAKGEHRRVDLEDIYDLARQLTSKPQSLTYAQA